MPLRDHFRPPVSKASSWEGFHGYWPAAIVQNLAGQLPPAYVAEPRVHLGAFCEIDVSAYESGAVQAVRESNSGGAVATCSPPAPSFAIDAEIPDQYEYEVLIHDLERDRTLVAAVEIVSPANKDRPESQQMFAAKCAGLLQKGVSVSVVDVVTNRRANLYVETLKLLGFTDPAFAPESPAIYAATCRKRLVARRTRFETWSHGLSVGQALPRLPIWLSEERAIWLDLEESYEATCRILRIPQ